MREIHINDLVKDCSNSIANAMELRQSCTKPSIYYFKRNVGGFGPDTYLLQQTVPISAQVIIWHRACKTIKLNQCRRVVIWTIWNKFQRNLIKSFKKSIQENSFDDVVCKMSPVLARFNVLTMSFGLCERDKLWQTTFVSWNYLQLYMYATHTYHIV